MVAVQTRNARAFRKDVLCNTSREACHTVATSLLFLAGEPLYSWGQFQKLNATPTC